MSQYLDKDGASRIAENFLSKQAEQDAILANLQFDLKEAEHALVKTVQGPAPLNIRALTRPLDDYLISGNTIQNGTPTPEAPVDVVGCGVRTGNLFDPNSTRYHMGKGANNKIGRVDNGAMFYIKAVPNTKYALKIHATDSTFIRLYLSNAPIVEGVAESYNVISESETVINPEVTITNTEYAYLWIQTGGTWYTEHGGSSIMLNTGSAPLPYEPYGYKLPLTIGGTEYPIYLGEVQTTRRIKKLVLDGTENFEEYSSAGLFGVRLSNPNMMYNGRNNGFCTHFAPAYTTSGATTDIITFGANSRILCITLSQSTIDTYSISDVSSFKSYLAAQYAAGTPVTIWYVLAEPETAVVNEPLHKIGNYADTISMTQANITLSTTKGFNAITTDTTVLPSNIEVKGVINNA